MEPISDEKLSQMIWEWITSERNCETRTDEEFALLQLLTSVKMGFEPLSLICDTLFKDNSITAFEVMELLQDEFANKELVEDYVAYCFLKSIERGEPQFVYAKAVFDVREECYDAVSNAIRRISDPDSIDADKVSGLGVVSLAAWLQVNRRRVRYLSNPFSVDDTFVDTLLDMLSDMDSLYFNLAVNCLENLYLLKKIDNRKLDQQRVLDAALSMLETPDLEEGRHAERLLAIMPFGVQLPESLRKKYQEAYFKSFESERSKNTVINLFRILAKTGHWESKNALMGAFEELEEKLKGVDDYQEFANLQLLRAEVIAYAG